MAKPSHDANCNSGCFSDPCCIWNRISKGIAIKEARRGRKGEMKTSNSAGSNTNQRRSNALKGYGKPPKSSGRIYPSA